MMTQIDHVYVFSVSLTFWLMVFSSSFPICIYSITHCNLETFIFVDFVSRRLRHHSYAYKLKRRFLSLSFTRNYLVFPQENNYISLAKLCELIFIHLKIRGDVLVKT
jgi:hypothetical protein